MVYKWLVVWVHLVALYTSRVHLANTLQQPESLRLRSRSSSTTPQNKTTATTKPQSPITQSQQGPELQKFIKTLNNFVENLVIKDETKSERKSEINYSSEKVDNYDDELAKYHVETLATPSDFYDNGASKRYRRENDGSTGVGKNRDGIGSEWDPVRKSKSNGFLDGINEENVDNEYDEVVNNQVDESQDTKEEDKKPPQLNVSDKNSPYALIDKYFPERESYFYQNKDNFINNYNKGHKPDIGNLYPEEVWLVDESLLVLKGGSTKDEDIFEDLWEPLDDYEAPYREPVLPPPDFDPDTLEIGVGVPLDQVHQFNHKTIPRPEPNPYKKTTTPSPISLPAPTISHPNSHIKSQNPQSPPTQVNNHRGPPAPNSGIQRGLNPVPPPPAFEFARDNEIIESNPQKSDKLRVLPTPSPFKMRSPLVSRNRAATPTSASPPESRFRVATPSPENKPESRFRIATKIPTSLPVPSSKAPESPKVRVSSLSPHNTTPVPQLRSYQDTIWSTVSPVYNALLRSTTKTTARPQPTNYPQPLSSQQPFKHEVNIHNLPTPKPPPTDFPRQQHNSQPAVGATTTFPFNSYPTTSPFNPTLNSVSKEIEHILQPYKNEVELGQEDYRAFIDEVNLFISKMENFDAEKSESNNEDFNIGNRDSHVEHVIQHQQGNHDSHVEHGIHHQHGNHDSHFEHGNHDNHVEHGNHDSNVKHGNPDVWSRPELSSLTPQEGNSKNPGNAPNFVAGTKQHEHVNQQRELELNRARENPHNPHSSRLVHDENLRENSLRNPPKENPVVTSSLPRRKIDNINGFRTSLPPPSPQPALKFQPVVAKVSSLPHSSTFEATTSTPQFNRNEHERTTISRSTTPPTNPPRTSTPVSSLPFRSQLPTSSPFTSSPTTPVPGSPSSTPSLFNAGDLGFDYSDLSQGFEAVKLNVGSHRGSIFGEGAKVISPIPEYDDRESATEALIDREHGISPYQQRSVYPRSTTTPAPSWIHTTPVPTAPPTSTVYPVTTTFSPTDSYEDNTIANTIEDNRDSFSRSLPDPIYSGFVPIISTTPATVAPSRYPTISRYPSGLASNPYPTLNPSIYPTLTAPGLAADHEFGIKLRGNNNYPDPSENEILEGIDRKGKSMPRRLINTRSRRPTPPPPPPLRTTVRVTPPSRRLRPNNTLSRLISRRRGAVRRRRPVQNIKRKSQILRPRQPAPPQVSAQQQSIDRSSAGAVRYVSFFSGVTGGQTWGYSYNLG